jgi:THO complex subunit 2
VADPAADFVRLKKKNTMNLYQQKKFNLLREDTEGFAKVLVLLFEAALKTPALRTSGSSSSSSKTAAAEAVHSKLCKLMGYFDLDPNRCMDLLLGVLEHAPQSLHMVPLFKGYQPNDVAHLLGFRFSKYAAAPARTPAGLYRVAAKLLAVVSRVQ